MAISDLQNTGSQYGLSFTVLDENAELPATAILVGDASGNGLTARLVKEGVIRGAISLEDSRTRLYRAVQN